MARLSFRSYLWLFAGATTLFGIDLMSPATARAACGDYVHIGGTAHSQGMHASRGPMAWVLPEISGPSRRIELAPGASDPQASDPVPPERRCDSPLCRGESPAPLPPAPVETGSSGEDWACLMVGPRAVETSVRIVSTETTPSCSSLSAGRIERPPRTISCVRMRHS